MYTIEKIMSDVNCTSFPERWRELFPEVIKEYEANGCIYSKPEYYVDLFNKYELDEVLLPTFTHAAEVIDTDESFKIFLLLTCFALRDRSQISELSSFVQPRSPLGVNDVKYDMLTALCMCSMMDYTYEMMLGKGYSRETTLSVIRLFLNGIRGFRERHDGADGYDLIRWFQLAIDGRLIPYTSGLQAETGCIFGCDAVIVENKEGETKIFAVNNEIHSSGRILGSLFAEDTEGSWISEYTETDTEFSGYVFNERGLVEKNRITLKKDHWTAKLRKGDPVISMHIPRGVPINDEALDSFFGWVEEFFKDNGHKAVVCGSWLIDPVLKDILGENSNIVSFQNHFLKVSVKNAGKAVFKFIFKKPDDNFDINELPENTRLEKAVKHMYLNNKAVYELYGVILRK